jgi:hypothetical protein
MRDVDIDGNDFVVSPSGNLIKNSKHTVSSTYIKVAYRMLSKLEVLKFFSNIDSTKMSSIFNPYVNIGYL